MGSLLFIASSSSSQSNARPQTFDSLAKRAAESRDADQIDEAISLFKKALALKPAWAEGWWSLGTLEYDRNNYTAAAGAFRRLLPLAPRDGTARVMLGLCEFELNQDAAALKHIQEGRTLGVANNKQLHEVTLYHEGILLLRAANFKTAQSTFGMLCKEGLQDDQVLNGLGLSVLRVSPKEAPPDGSPGARVVLRVGRAACFITEKKFDEAREEYAELLKDYPRYPGLRYAFGLYFVEANNPQAAVEQFKQEIANDPKNISARLEIAAALYKVDSPAALPYAEEAVKLKPSMPFPHYLLGLLYLDTDNYQKAIPELEIAQKAFPKDAKVYFALGSAYSRAGRKLDAERTRATFERLSKESASQARASY
jgi:tetratricopeptide (TPR) repeat protein